MAESHGHLGRMHLLRCGAMVLLWLGCAGLLRAQTASKPWRAFAQPQFTTLTTSDGLPANTIASLAQGKLGYIWIGTANGLVRYDGQHFVTIVPQVDDPRGLADGYIRALLVLDDGRIMVGTNNGGLALLDPRSMRFTPIPLGHARTTDVKIMALRQARNGGVWVASMVGVDYFDPNTGTATPLDLTGYPADASRTIFDIAERGDGRLYLGTGLGLFTRAPGSRTFQRVVDPDYPADDLVWRLYIDLYQRLWVGTDTQGLFVINPDGSRWAPPGLSGADGLTLGRTIRDFQETADGRLLISTYGSGVIVCPDRACGKPHVIKATRDSPGALADNVVRTLLLDASGTLWLGSSSGLSFTPFSRDTVLHVSGTPERLPAIRDRAIRVILVDDKDRIWLGLNDNGVVILDLADGSSRHLHMAPAQARQPITSLVQGGDGTVWVAGLGVTGFDPDSLEPVARIQALASRRVTALGRDGDALVISTYDGVYRYHDGHLSSLASGSTDATARALQNTHWILQTDRQRWYATIQGLVLQRLGQPQWQRFHHRHDDPHSLPQNAVSMLAWDRLHQRLWAATKGGLVWRDLQADEGANGFHRVATSGPAERITAVVVDAQGNAWASGDNRLIRVDADTLAVTPLTQRDGLPRETFVWRAAAVGPHGALLFGGTGGLTVVRPTAVEAHARATEPLRISRIHINGKARPLFTAMQPELALASDQRAIAADFSLLSYRAPQDIRYSYRLAGFEDAWHAVPPGTPASAVYTNLPTGDFELQLRARIGGLDAQVINHRVALSVAPRWYQTWPARLLQFAALLLVAAGLIYVGLRWSRHRQRVLDRLIAQRTHELEEANDLLATLAATDALTGLYGRRTVMEHASRAMEETAAHQQPLAMLLIDLDHFKRVNDTHGHLAGDAILKAVAQAISDNCHGADFGGRYGGEEFVICMPNSDIEAGLAQARRLRADVAALEVGYGGETLSITCSIGVAGRRPEDTTLAKLLARADQALYAAKAAGRNRVKLAA